MASSYYFAIIKYTINIEVTSAVKIDFDRFYSDIMILLLTHTCNTMRSYKQELPSLNTRQNVRRNTAQQTIVPSREYPTGCIIGFSGEQGK